MSGKTVTRHLFLPLVAPAEAAAWWTVTALILVCPATLLFGPLG